MSRSMRTGGIDYPQRANPRYLIMVNLRKRVWKKVGWDNDGKGVDPWAGRTREGPCQVAIGEEVEDRGLDVIHRREGFTERLIAPTDIEPWNSWNADNGTGLDNLDAILTGDPLDMFQWDEWESLTSDFFAGA